MKAVTSRIVAALALTAALSAPALAVTVITPQTTSGNTAPTTPASNTDLLQTNLASVAPVPGTDNLLTHPAKRNGTTGTAHANDGTNPANVNNAGTYDYILDTVAFPLGYRVDEVVIYTGWTDFRAGQDETVWYSLIGNAAFVQFADVNIAHSNGTLRVSLTDSLGPIASGVDAIRVVVDQSTFVYREVDVHGAGVTVPEPATLSLLAIAGAGLLRRRRVV